MGRQSAAEGQELGERSVHRDGPESYGHDDVWHAAVRDKLWKCCAQLGLAWQLGGRPNWGTLRAGSGSFTIWARVAGRSHQLFSIQCHQNHSARPYRFRYARRTRLLRHLRSIHPFQFVSAPHVKFQCRLARGLQAIASYTFSHSIDSASTDALLRTSTRQPRLFGCLTQTLANSLRSGGANGGFNPRYQIGGPRSIQLALKLQF
jgi:hypothetical protein